MWSVSDLSLTGFPDLDTEAAMDPELHFLMHIILYNANFILRFKTDHVTPVIKQVIIAFTTTIAPCTHITTTWYFVRFPKLCNH